MTKATEKLLNTIFSLDLRGKVTTVIGPSGTGKTSFVGMQLPLYYILKEKGEREGKEPRKAIIINTDYSWSSERFMQILKSSEVSYADVRSYIEIQSPATFTQQEELVKRVFRNCLESDSDDVCYLSIDPFNHTLRMEFAKAHEDYRLHTVGRLSPRLEYQLNILTLLARRKNVAVVITMFPKKKYTEMVPVSWQSGFFGPTEIAHLSDIVVWFHPNKLDKGTIDIHIMKHRTRSCGEIIKCRISERGLELA